MKGIVINLDRRSDRWKHFQDVNLSKLPFEIERFSAYDIVPGEDGCTKSHLEVLHRQTEYPFIVFEDDCIMTQEWYVVEECMSQLPPCWDALWLGANLTRPLRRYSKNTFLLYKSYCLHAVIYNSKRMVDFILENHKTPKGKNLDIFYYNTVQDKFNCFITDPLCATQKEGYSDIAKKPTGSWIIEDTYARFTNSTRVVKPIRFIQPTRRNEIPRRRIR